ncbi:MAG: eCIS core domain-containing protein [Blastococcus sp.]
MTGLPRRTASVRPQPSPVAAAPPARQLRQDARPLPDVVRTRMETAFGADFSDVTVREDAGVADQEAVALTTGSRVTFAPGEYDPHSPEGLEAIGHELAHVLQQRSGRVSGQGVTDDPALEGEAHEAGRRAASGQPVPAIDGVPTGGGSTEPAAAVAQPMWRSARPRDVNYPNRPAPGLENYEDVEEFANAPREVKESPYANIPVFRPPVPTAPKPPLLPKPRRRNS